MTVRKPTASELLEVEIRQAGSIGKLERLAGITDRAAFWEPYSKIPDGAASLDAGVAELKRLIRAREVK